MECGVNEYGDCFCDAIDRGSAGAGALEMCIRDSTTDEESFLLLLRNRKKLSEILPKPIIP